MTNYNYSFAVFIGRFQPYHNGHHHVIQQGLQQAERLVVLCGSSHMPPSHRNPWSFQERKRMILDSFVPADAERITVLPLIDSPYNDAVWIQSVQTIVNGLVQAFHNVPHRQPKVALIGHSKDHSSYYLKLFPQWESISVGHHFELDATAIRRDFFSDTSDVQAVIQTLSANCPSGTVDYLANNYSPKAFEYIFEENAFVQAYRQSWSQSPYPPLFMTVDAIVVQSGHILLVKRRAKPGFGLMALPGGFVGQYEKLVDAALRELREETRLKVPEPVLRGCIKQVHTFDDPYRSARGRTITQALLIELPNADALPKVKAGDDAAKAFWLPLADLQPDQLFEDHYFIIRQLLGLGEPNYTSAQPQNGWQDYRV
jgi:bifunctional NMN adenylyltransferase/nudix hydrolase